MVKKVCLITVTRDLSKEVANACIFCFVFFVFFFLFFKKRPTIDINIEYVLFYNKVPLFLYELQNKKQSLIGVRAPPSRNKDLNRWDHTFFHPIYLHILHSAVSARYRTHLLEKQMNAGFLYLILCSMFYVFFHHFNNVTG